MAGKLLQKCNNCPHMLFAHPSGNECENIHCDCKAFVDGSNVFMDTKTERVAPLEISDEYAVLALGEEPFDIMVKKQIIVRRANSWAWTVFMPDAGGDYQAALKIAHLLNKDAKE